MHCLREGELWCISLVKHAQTVSDTVLVVCQVAVCGSASATLALVQNVGNRCSHLSTVCFFLLFFSISTCKHRNVTSEKKVKNTTYTKLPVKVINKRGISTRERRLLPSIVIIPDSAFVDGSASRTNVCLCCVLSLYFRV